MDDKAINGLAAIVRNPEQELAARLAALRELAGSNNKDVLPELLKIWKRPKKKPEIIPMDWDPVAVERVVDAHTIAALYKHGDSSQLSDLANLVRQAGDVLSGPYAECATYATVVKEIKSVDPVNDLVHLTADSKPAVVANAVRTLQLIGFPGAPTSGQVPEILALQEPVHFTIHRLSDELTTIAHLSRGAVELSSGVQELIHTHDYDRGEVARTDTTLHEILTQEIDLLGVTYAVVSPNRVSICTFEEAGRLWREKWPAYRSGLARQGWTGV